MAFTTPNQKIGKQLGGFTNMYGGRRSSTGSMGGAGWGGGRWSDSPRYTSNYQSYMQSAPRYGGGAGGYAGPGAVSVPTLSSGGTAWHHRSMAPQPAASPMSGGMQANVVGSGINPGGIFSHGDTQRHINQMADQAFADTDWLAKKYMRPGRSLGPGELSLTTPEVAQRATQARTALFGQPMQDYLTNQSHLLQGQVAQGKEGVAAMNNQLQAMLQADQFGRAKQGALMNLLGDL